MLRTFQRVAEILYNKIVQMASYGAQARLRKCTQGPVFLVRRAVVGRRSSVRTDRSLVVGSVSCFLRPPVESTCRVGGAGFRGGGGGAQVGHTCPDL